MKLGVGASTAATTTGTRAGPNSEATPIRSGGADWDGQNQAREHDQQNEDAHANRLAQA
jgi:hypothetical protein